MRFQDFIERGTVRKGERDIQLAKSLIKMSENQIKSMQSLGLTDVTASTIMATYYEALREIVEAICAKSGYKVYSHEAFTYFLKELGEDVIAEKFDRFRKIRNGINYYGKQIDKESVKTNKEDIVKIIGSLKSKFLSDV
ncbi:MAG: hypothetical protein HY512_04035 [Candidatus Aenigmarchaeota archaeon]|nr:hypothetical protein [Candidatus Aenigmarchaeota archaeon]